MEPLLTREEMEDVLGVKYDTLQKLIFKEGLPALRVGMGKGQWRFRPEQVQKWLDARELNGPKPEIKSGRRK